ncbi:Lysophospholipase 1 [Puccinia graminis f. sp. tritici]|uniref:Lysophospholipase n=2 Tax=Puccinia graminis f. sp. tritici TaxID=56615 RepID=A0A5B0M7T0_PUCGR|nr:Lysophospholipase 1 [Puccinia graminis f. sp. tritici]
MNLTHHVIYLWCLFHFTVTPSTSYNLNRQRLTRRDAAISNSPSGNYAPVVDKCPTDFFTRQPNDAEAKLSKSESDYINTRAGHSIPLWEDYLNRVQLKDFDVNSFLHKAKQNGGKAGETLPNLGFSLSGGGARALCVTASILDAFDSRNEKANEGQVGGILQLANYAAGVSGSSWLLGSWATSNFPRISTLDWRLDEENDLWDWNVAKHFLKVWKIVKKKKKAGFHVSIVDAWAILLNRHFINDPENKDPQTGKAVLWSSIRQTSGYKERSAPYVMAIATSRPEKKTAFTPETPIYEFTPEEFGVWHPYLNVSIPMEYLGSPPETYKSPSTSSCVKGFDNAGFVMGMSSNIYSAADSPDTSDLPSFIRMLDKFVDDDDWEGKLPNTFQGLGKNGHFQDDKRDTLLMADCALTMENVPIFPFLQPSRKIDVIIAVDSSADGVKPSDPIQYGYPNGTALYTIYTKTLQPHFSGYRMPKIPNPYDGSFTKAGYHQRPTFFGCDSKPKTPLIIYLPNYYMIGKTNVPTKETTYSKERMDEFFENGFAIATQNTGFKADTEWPACLACALIDHQIQRNSQARTKQCQKCFDSYCARV